MKNVFKALTVVASFVGVTNEAMSATPFSLITKIELSDVLAYSLVGGVTAVDAAISAFGLKHLIVAGMYLFGCL